MSTGTVMSASYAAVHQRLRRTRGRAHDQTCTCGAAAVAWAYDKTDPAPLVEWTGKSRVTYSADTNRYVALCQACHHALDHPAKAHCNHGHEMSDVNTYNRPDGTRLCRTCKRETLRRWRAEHPNWREGIS